MINCFGLRRNLKKFKRKLWFQGVLMDFSKSFWCFWVYKEKKFDYGCKFELKIELWVDFSIEWYIFDLILISMHLLDTAGVREALSNNSR